MSERLSHIRQQLSTLQPSHLDIIDESHLHAGHAGAKSGGGHYRIHLVSSDFVGKNTMSRHRMVYSALAELLKREIHALTLRTETPEEFALSH